MNIAETSTGRRVWFCLSRYDGLMLSEMIADLQEIHDMFGDHPIGSVYGPGGYHIDVEKE